MTPYTVIVQRWILLAGAAGFLLVSCTPEDEKAGSVSSEAESTSGLPSASLEGDLEVLTRDGISVKRGSLLENSRVKHLIPEANDHELQISLPIDVRPGDKAAGSLGDSIAAKTVVSSYLLHFDSKGSGETVLSGRVKMPEPAIGIITSGSKQDASDKELGLATVTYSEPGQGKMRSINLKQNDELSTSSDRQTIDLTLRNWDGADQLRILTAAP